MTVDLLPYMRGDGRIYELQVDVDGEQNVWRKQTQRDAQDPNIFYEVRDGAWLRMYADDQYIYRETDTREAPHLFFTHQTDGLSGAVWSRRNMEVGQRTEIAQDTIHFYQADCSERVRNASNTVTQLLEVKPSHTFANGRRVEDVVVLGWIAKDDSIEERFYYARDYGFVGWENVHRGTISIVHDLLNERDLVREAVDCLPQADTRFAMPPQATHVRVKETGDEGLNIRTERRVTANSLIAIAQPGTILKVINRYRVWWEVELFASDNYVDGGVRGFLHGAFVEPIVLSAESTTTPPSVAQTNDRQYVEVTAPDFLNVRTQPSTFENTIIAAALPGTIFEVIGGQGDWLAVVVYNDKNLVDGQVTGFVHSDYVRFLPQNGGRTIEDITDSLPKHPTQSYRKRSLAGIVAHAVHHTAVNRNVGPERVAAFHVNSRNWPGIGYTFFITADGKIYQTNALDTMSYAVADQNHRYVSTVLAGSFVEGQQPTPAQIDALRWLHHDWLVEKFGRNLPLIGHKQAEGQQTSCPGDSWDWNTLIA